MKHAKFIIYASVLLLVLGTLPTVVKAEEIISGTGTLTAEGRGRAHLSGTGTITAEGIGGLWMVDRGGDAVIEVTGIGRRTEFTRNGEEVIRFIGFNGSATMTGNDIAVAVRGVRLHLTAEGTGRAFLQGHGSYTVGNLSGRWTQSGVTIEIID